MQLMESRGEWPGTASDLLREVHERAGEEKRGLPETARGMSNRLDRHAPLLRQKGIDVQRRKGTERLIITNASGPQDRSTAEGAHFRIRRT